MRVNPNSDILEPAPVSNRVVVRDPGLGQDQVAVGTADALNRALAATPEARPDKVADAQSKVQDLTYPPEVLIRKISSLLASQIAVSNQAQ